MLKSLGATGLLLAGGATTAAARPRFQFAPLSFFLRFRTLGPPSSTATRVETGRQRRVTPARVAMVETPFWRPRR